MTMFPANCTATARPSITKRFPVYATLVQLHDVWRQRRALKSLDAAALSDIGVTYKQARAEAGRPIWDAPQNWRH